MRKLKIALVVLFAMAMSLFLFACKPKGGDENKIQTIRSASGVPTFTDSDDESKLESKMANLTLRVRYENPDEDGNVDGTVKGSECTFTHNIVWHTVGSYEIVVKPTENNADGKTYTVTVELDHDFHATNTEGVEQCAYDGALRTTRTEDATISYDGFHAGTNNKLFGNVKGSTTVKNDNGNVTALGEATYDANANSAFKQFGQVNWWDGSSNPASPATVPTVTVGQLEPGMTISVSGTAVWRNPTEDKGYYFPIIGIADRTLNGAGKFPVEQYEGGTSVIVRNDGHVLYNGIGNPDALLASLAGGTSEDNFPNYGSGTQADAALPEGYGSLGVLPSLANWHDWYVYSTDDGAIRSGEYYTEKNITLTWYYHDGDALDGVIEMTITSQSGSTVNRFKSYTKVPDSAMGYYDTILHGEYVDMYFTSSSVTETRSATGIYFKSLEGGVYYENEAFDASKISMEITYEQSGSQKFPYVVTADNVYGTTDAEIGEATVWTSLASGMNSAYKHYKVEVVKSGKTLTAEIPDGTIKVLPNSVVSVTGGNTGSFTSIDKIGSLSIKAVVEGSDEYIQLKLGSGVNTALPIPSGQSWTGGEVGENHRYIALRIELGALGADKNITSVSVPYIYTHEAESKVAYLVLALTAEDVESGVTIEGISETKIKLDLTGLVGFNVISSVTGQPSLYQNGEVKIAYTISGDVAPSAVQISIDGVVGSVTLERALGGGASLDYGAYEVSATGSGGSYEVTISMQKPTNLANLSLPIFRLTVNGVVEAEDIVYYAMTLGGDTYEDGNYVYVSSNTMYIVRVVDTDKLDASQLSGSFSVNANAGGSIDGVRLIKYSYSYSARVGGLVFSDAAKMPGTITLNTFGGTVGNDNDIDHGALIIVAIPYAELGVSGTFYYEINPSETVGSYVYKVTGTTITREQVTGANEAVLLEEGDCWHEGLVAVPLTDESGKIYFYAAAHEIGGAHSTTSGTCSLCGAFVQNIDLPVWGSAQTVSSFSEGETLDMKGTFANNVSESYGSWGPIVTVIERDGTRYWLRTDGFFVGFPGGAWWTANDMGPANALGNNGVPTERMYTTLDYNTLNGVLSLDGESLDSATLGSYFANKSFHYVMTYRNGTIKIDVSYYNADGTLSLNYYVEIRGVSGGVTAGYTSEPAGNINGKIVMAYTNANSYVSGVSTSNFEVDGVDTVDYTVSSNKLTITGNGKAAAMTSDVASYLGIDASAYEYYLAFTVELSQVLDTDNWLVSLKKDGVLVPDAKVWIDGDDVHVIIPVQTGSMGVYVLDFASMNASTLQDDVTLDLTNVIASDVTASAEGTLYINGDSTITLTYTGSLSGTKLVLGDSSLDIFTLAAGQKLGDLEVVSIDDGSSYSVTFKLASLDLTKALSTYVIDLVSSTGDLLARLEADAANIQKSAATELEGAGWYVWAEGTTLYIAADASANMSPSKLGLNINSGSAMGANKALINYHDISYRVSGGVAVVNGAGNLLRNATTAAYTKIGDKELIVYTLDLGAAIGLTAGTAYGIELEGGEKFYIVEGGSITEHALSELSGNVDIAEAGCEVDGVAAKNFNDKFYGDLDVTAATGHDFDVEPSTTADKHGYDLVYLCKNDCGAAKYVVSEGVTQSWGSGTPGNYLGWGSFGWEQFAVVYKGGLYEITGTNYSNTNNIWDLPEPGISHTATANADGFRLDAYLQNDNTSIDLTYVYSFYNNKEQSTIANATALGNLLKGGDSKYKYLDGATITYTFDYTDADALYIIMHIVHGEDLDVTATVKLTGDLLDTYYLMFHQDGNKYDATGATAIVPAGKEVPEVLSKHVHSYDPDTDRCPEDGTLNPEHNHSYDADGWCKCGAVNAEHKHKYANGLCYGCEAAQNWEDLKDSWTAYGDGEGVTGDTALWNSTVASATLQKGKTLIVLGEMQTDMVATGGAANAYWATLVWELAEGWTFHAGYNSWSYGAGDTNFSAPTITRHNSYNSAHELGEVWEDYVEILKDCYWRVECDWTGDDLVFTTTITSATNGNTYVIQYVLPVKANLEQITMTVGGDHVDSLRVGCYTVI